jgi:DNA repair protein RecN (Recombination protein N)
MLIELRIRDYAVIDELRLELGPGLTVLTGETGAGKSIVVGALSLLLGERASADVVRSGADRARVEAVFDVAHRPEVEDALRSAGLEPQDDLLILAREVAAEGRNRAWVNGSPATAGTVGELGRLLVDLHGQHEHQTLLRGDEQRWILDAYAGASAVAERVRGLHREAAGLRQRLDDLEARRRESESRADFLRFQWQEIHEAGVQAGEDIQLEDEVRRLENAEGLLQGAQAVAEGLYGGDEAVSDRLAALRDEVRALARVDPALTGDAAALEEAYHEVVEVGRRLEGYAASVELDPSRLEEVRARLDRLFRLKRKYGPGVEDVLATGAALRSELDQLEGAGESRTRLAEERDATLARLGEAAAVLSRLRGEAAARLSGEVESLLPDLGMRGAVIRVQLQPLPEVGAVGAERVEFLASLNAGFEPRPLGRIASGGELSRVMLALKSILARVDRVPTLIFDEIDAGVGGAAAVGLAARLQEVANHHQVLVITHLPQVAARARRHLLVEKVPRQGLTATDLRPLEGEDRVVEVARMLGGDPESRTSRQHARELLSGG